jgi:CRISPR system Cascade subunit CasE
MYLSRVEINRQRFETKRALANPQIMHAAIMSCFPSSGERILWRVDNIDPTVYILVTSGTKPDFTSLVQQFGWPASEQTGETKDYETFLSRVENGSEWRFRLTANPVYSKSPGGKESGQRGKLFPHVTVKQQKKWLVDRAEPHGFRIAASTLENPDLDAIDPLDRYLFNVVYREIKKFKRAGKIVTISVAAFEGILVVEDAEPFVQTLRNGLGRAKAYGCGLLTLAPVKSVPAK